MPTLNTQKNNLSFEASYHLLIADIQLQFQIQSQEPNGHPSGGHPDPIVRSCYQAAYNLLQTENFPSFGSLVKEILIYRPNINSTHFVNLWFRSLQYYFRKNFQLGYLDYKCHDWEKFFTTVHNQIFLFIADTIKNNNTATHVPQRYRSLRAALAILSQNSNINLRVGDIGCSLGLGLKACLKDNYLLMPEFDDLTPREQIKNLLRYPLSACSRAVAIDVKLPSVDWVKACNYPSRYEIDSQIIDQTIDDLAVTTPPVFVSEGDILNNETISLLTGHGSPLNIIYSSLALYELDSYERALALENINSSLVDGGIFVEFTFIDPLNWFNGVHTLVSQKKNNILTAPIQWLVWKDSRCTVVSPGADYETVSKLLCDYQQLCQPTPID